MKQFGQIAAVCTILVACTWGPPSALARDADAQRSGEDPLALRREGFRLIYNLDYEDGLTFFNREIALRPQDPAAHRSMAVAAWLQTLFRRGAVMVDFYLGGVTKPKVDMPKPPRDLAEQFDKYANRALVLSEQLVDKRPQDPDALYELGATAGLIASYRASVEGELLGALRAARRAYDAHSRVLELDPTRKDAGLVVGTYRYLVSRLPLPLRVMAYLVGFDAGKEEGLRLIEEAAAYPSDTQPEAQFALVLMYNRERRFIDALRVLRQLERLYPKNRLIWLEEGSTALRARRASDAEAALLKGLAMLDQDRRQRMLGEAALWRLQLGTARVLLSKRDEARLDLESALSMEAHEWVRGRTRLELGKLADLAGDRGTARRQYQQSVELCEAGNDRRCAAEAKRLRESAYGG